VALTRHRILIVEDDRTARQALSILLDEEGYDVTEAATGAEALAALDRVPVELALVDYRLPDVDGTSLIRAIRARVDCACVMVTGSADLLDDDEGPRFRDLSSDASGAGAVGYLGKPVDVDALLALIRRHLA